MSDLESKLRELAIRGATEGERQAALTKLEELRKKRGASTCSRREVFHNKTPISKAVADRPHTDYEDAGGIWRFFISYATPGWKNRVCFCCGRREDEMSEGAAWQGEMSPLAPIEKRRLICADCGYRHPRPCSWCGEVTNMGLSGGDGELCHECFGELLDRVSNESDDDDGGGGDDGPELPPGPPKLGSGARPHLRVVHNPDRVPRRR